LKFRSPLRIGDLKLFVCEFRFALALGQIALLKETPGMVVLGLGSAGQRVLDWKEKLQDERKQEYGAQPLEFTTEVARLVDARFNLI
jgi:hypothetical protein